MNDLGRTILITGATGTVGSEVVKQLVSSWSPSSSSSPDQSIIRAAVHSQNNADKLRQYGETVEIVHMDYNKPETISAALHKVGKLFLLTLPSLLNMADISSKVVSEAKKNDVKYIVKLSVFGADAEPGITIRSEERRVGKE